MWLFVFGKQHATKEPDGTATVFRFLAQKEFEDQEIKMKLICVYGDKAFQISAVKQW
jgi:hypothetical protein